MTTQPAQDLNFVFQHGASVLGFAQRCIGAGRPGQISGAELGTLIDVLAAAFATMVANDPARERATYEFERRVREFAFMIDNQKHWGGQ